MSTFAVFGVPLYNHAAFLEEAVESLLAQTRTDIALVLVDDASTDESEPIARALAGRDPRVTYLRNERRLGMIENWQHAFACARELYPEARYFAWGSDHDRWHPQWLERLSSVLETDPGVVLAYPLFARLDGQGTESRRKTPSLFETRAVDAPLRRFASTLVGAAAGSLVYGLYRADALERAGVFRHALAPDRLLLAELALQGRFALLPDVLWWRRFKADVSNARQRRMLFAGRAPLWSYSPWYLQHAAVLAWEVGARGAGRPAVSRPLGLAAAAAMPPLALARTLRRFERRTRRDTRRTVRRARRRVRPLARSLRRLERRTRRDTRRAAGGVRRRIRALARAIRPKATT